MSRQDIGKEKPSRSKDYAATTARGKDLLKF